MRISRRTSGGRGEYEVSETIGPISPQDLEDHLLSIDLDEDWSIDTGIVVRKQGGKHRLRISAGTSIQLPRQLAAALLMPSPVRENVALGRGRPILKSDRYAIEHIRLANVAILDRNHARIQIDEIELRNLDLLAEDLLYRRRVQDVRAIWNHADELPAEIARLIREHQELALAGTAIPPRAEKVVAEIEAALTEAGADLGIVRQGGEDAVPDLLRAIDLSLNPPDRPIPVGDVDPEEVEIKRRTAREWKRWAANRGASSARFSREVREAYRWTCVVCGARFPRTSFNRIAGVDAAHILPWADFDLDHVSNGLCLCKTHHWAFDEGILIFRWDEDAGKYLVEVSAEAERIIARENPSFSLDQLRNYEGAVPEERLPSYRNLWPRPDFLEEYYNLYHRL